VSNRISFLAVLGIAAVPALCWGQAQSATSSKRLEVLEKYQAAPTVLKDGKSVPVRARLSQIVVAGREPLTDLPTHGFMLMQLRGGKVSITINGKEEKHVNGDFWVVPANAKISISATGETATVEIISLSL
jgi:hypothetical protein